MPRVLLLAAAIAVAGPARAAEEKSAKAAPYVHVVLFTVKKDAPNGTADALIADAHELLAKIPTVRELRVGKPADKSTEIAKKDYHVGLVIFFDDYEGLKTYLDHPLHLKYVEKHLKNVDAEKLGVYDFLHKK